MLLQLDFSSDLPIYLQIRNQIVLGIASGALVPGERLPTIRTLADEAGEMCIRDSNKISHSLSLMRG